MTRALILVDHGSKRAEANELLVEVGKGLEVKLTDHFILAAHMELAEPSIEAAFGICAERGIKDITVFPYFLGPGRHTTLDIPKLCKEAALKHPEINYKLTEPLGLHDKILEVILERIKVEPRGLEPLTS